MASLGTVLVRVGVESTGMAAQADDMCLDAESAVVPGVELVESQRGPELRCWSQASTAVMRPRMGARCRSAATCR